MVILFLLIFLLTLLIFAGKNARYQTYFGSVFISAVSFFAYYMAIPLEMLLTGDGFARDDHGVRWIEPEHRLEMIGYGALAFLSFCIGLQFHPVAGLKKQLCVLTSFNDTAPRSILWLTGGCFFVLSLVIAQNSALIFDYASRVAFYYSNPAFSYIVTIASVTYSMLLFVWIQGHTLSVARALLLATPMLAFGLLSGSKWPILMVLLALSTLIWRYRLVRRRLFIPLAFVGILGLGSFALISFSLYRGGAEESAAQFLSERGNGIFRWSDPAGPLLSLHDSIKNAPSELLYGRSYAQALVQWVPRFIYPDRPIDLSEAYARTYIADWSEGVGVGFSLMAEALMNFGRVGIVVQYLFLGIFWNIFWGIISRMMSHRLLFAALYYVYGGYILIVMHRGPVSGIFIQLAQIVMPIMVLHWLMDGRKARIKSSGAPSCAATAHLAHMKD